MQAGGSSKASQGKIIVMVILGGWGEAKPDQYSYPEYESSQPTSIPDDKQLNETIASRSSGGSGSRNEFKQSELVFKIMNSEMIPSSQPACPMSTCLMELLLPDLVKDQAQEMIPWNLPVWLLVNDKLLDGLIPTGFDERSCLSRSSNSIRTTRDDIGWLLDPTSKRISLDHTSSLHENSTLVKIMEIVLCFVIIIYYYYYYYYYLMWDNESNIGVDLDSLAPNGEHGLPSLDELCL
ncbi:hypothetical protein GH714_013071 [Hevea brasiliensis]|uniref:Uncharacterized protein n=1 Tax=Hevea brasiliensis TaxID=3981 RepID=A0A6A6N012_HEVBR|nr:hypothetical protein GH714_013071 [Hevea brasiliensis]